MKDFKRFLAVIICFIFVGIIILNNNSANAAVAKLSPTTMNLSINQTEQIKILNKNKEAVYSFKSSDNKIALVSKSGTVKALKKGRATITVKSTHKKKVSKVGTVKVTVKALTATPTPAPNYKKVACVGDSITVGSSGALGSYPKVLQELLGSKYLVKNYGISGTTMLKKGGTPYWNSYAFNQSTSWLPDIVIIMLGTNDSNPKSWKYKSEFVSDYKDMINHYKNLDSHPVVYVATCATVYSEGNWGITDEVVTKEIVPLIIQAAKETDCKVIDINTLTKGMPENFPDFIHPNKDGYKIIGEAVYNAITDNSSESKQNKELLILEH